MQDKQSTEKQPGWEKQLLEKLAFEQLKEYRRSRRWGVFFKSLAFLYVFVLLVLAIPDEFSDSKLGKDVTAIVEVKGLISDDTEASADNVISGLRDAFEHKHTKGVIVRINSPGGSPVQAGYIHDEINRLRKKYEDIPVYAVVTDICASGGYYIAAAADKIYVDKSSIVGSIGVLMNGYGFVGTMDKLGVERRLLTAGEHKAILDPFSPVNEFDVQHVQSVLDEMHAQFIEVVKKGRGVRLQENDEIFSGLFWSGEKSIELGLADALGSSSYVAREVVGAEDLKDFTKREDVFERFADRLGASIASKLGLMSGLGETPQIR
ncbi:MAG: S49 family peptidase [Chromatiales bacterium]|jgi:protease-4